MKGSYVLIIKLDKDKEIEIGKLGKIKFKKGYYAYVGSALNNMEKRIERHFRKKKKMRWHIDYFLKHSKIIAVFYKESNKKEECKIASKFSLPYIKNFGCSDCKCKSHLFYAESYKKILDIVKFDLKRFK